MVEVVSGKNFSGRSSFLKNEVDLLNTSNVDTAGKYAFIGPETTGNLSGLTPTALAEIELFAIDENAYRQGVASMKSLELEHCLQQNPFTLSGGEQVILAILAALSSKPEKLAIDCAFEQLSSRMRKLILKLLTSGDTQVLICDNRDSEWFTGIRNQMIPSVDTPKIRGGILQTTCKPIEISIENLSFSYKNGREIFRDLNLEFSSGTCYRLKGENGVGKSTLAKLICGVLKPESGQIYMNGDIFEPWKKPGAVTAYHFQNPDYQLFSNTVREQFKNKKVMIDVAQKFGIKKYLDEHPLDLPFVLRKRIALSSAMARNVPFFIFDEPTLGQDDNNAGHIVEEIRNRPGFVISHSTLFDDFPVIDLDGVGTL